MRNFIEKELFEYPPGNICARVFEHKLTGLRVLISRCIMINGDKFNHVSVSHENRDVTWNDLTKVRNEFLDKTAPAYHVIAPVSRHVNLHYNCFHIWQPIGAVKEIADLNNIEWEFAL